MHFMILLFHNIFYITVIVRIRNFIIIFDYYTRTTVAEVLKFVSREFKFIIINPRSLQCIHVLTPMQYVA